MARGFKNCRLLRLGRSPEGFPPGMQLRPASESPGAVGTGVARQVPDVAWVSFESEGAKWTRVYDDGIPVRVARCLDGR